MKKQVKSFRIKSEYVTDVPLTRDIVLELADGSSITGTSYGTIDHPEFTKLRNKLEKLGYIQTERGWWNGDRVLNPFIINGMKLDKGDKFCCASALSIQLSVRKKHGPR